MLLLVPSCLALWVGHSVSLAEFKWLTWWVGHSLHAVPSLSGFEQVQLYVAMCAPGLCACCPVMACNG
jgi:hypothetical protein